DAVMNITQSESNGRPFYSIELKTNKASPEKSAILKLIISGIIDKFNLMFLKPEMHVAELKEEVVEGREYKTIDFILPGQLGFSILGSGVFGTAFVFLMLRDTLVLKRFFATPIKKRYIILGEALSRLIFSL